MEAETCTNCEEPIAHATVYFDGRPYCCVGCVAGGPCLCTYEAPTPQPAARPASVGAPAAASQAVPRTGATKFQHADRLLNSEVERARRYARPFTVMVIAPDDWPEYVQRVGRQQSERMIAELAQGYLGLLRAVDTLIQTEGAEFLALLPETGVEGAQVAAEKLASSGEELLGVDVRTGIASFPDDEVTAAGLMREAEEALAFAQAASIRVASRSLLT